MASLTHSFRWGNSLDFCRQLQGSLPRLLTLCTPLLMGYKLEEWEESFGKNLKALDASKKRRAGAILPLVPDRDQWNDFLSVVRSDWGAWESAPDRYPACLVVLYGGLAFFEYDENKFWPYFAASVGKTRIPPNQQSELNHAFSRALEHFGVGIPSMIAQGTPHSYVSLAVSQVGIPLSLWDGFLEVCDWASWLDNWDKFTDEEWSQEIAKRTGSRNRLKNFLIANRDTGTAIIKELLEVKAILTTNPEWGVTELSHACFLRTEYFEEVPETAEFLRPTNPDSLIRDRAQLIWDDQRTRIVLYLPGVQPDKLPATWSLDHLHLSASRSPGELVLNSLAFQGTLNLKLASGSRIDAQGLRGINPWGLFDLDRGGRLTNQDREYQPLHSYALVSPTPLPHIIRNGFDETDSPINQEYELVDGTHCFLTHLDPTGSYAELTIGDGPPSTVIRFRTNSKIEARFFVGREHRAANFAWIGSDKRKIEHLPILCLSIPLGYFRNTQATLREKFRVRCDDRPAGGKWDYVPAQTDFSEKELFTWNWGPRPFFDVPSGTYRAFSEIAQSGRSPDLRGERTFSVESQEFKVDYKVYIDHPKPGMDDCWRDLPGAFLPWFLLCQTQEGLKWDELLFARDIIAPGLRLSAYLLRKYEKEGFFVQKGVRWMIAESRGTLANTESTKCCLDYCGDPSVLWRFYRIMSRPGIGLPNIEIVNKRGEVPFLRMNWENSLRDEIIYRLRGMNVRIGSSLWNH